MLDFQPILTASLDALGTPDAIARIRTISAFADCTAPRGTYTTEIHSARGGRVWFKQTWADRVPTTVIINPQGAWATDTATGETEPLDAVSVAMIRGHEFQMLPLTLNERYTDAKVIDNGYVGDEICHVVYTLDDLQLPCYHFLSRRTKRWMGMQVTSPGDHTQYVRVAVNTWSEIEGVFLPATVTATDPSGDYVLDFKTITLNTAPDSLFEAPLPFTS